MNPQTPQIQIKDYWTVFKRRWWLILLAFVIVVGATAIYLVRTPRQYEATAVVRIPTSDGGGGLTVRENQGVPERTLHRR